jgi:CheY-like chemotaxis protein
MNRDDKVNILLVDDQPARLLSYETILAELGQNLVSARSGVEALKCLMADDFAVVLSMSACPRWTASRPRASFTSIRASRRRRSFS